MRSLGIEGHDRLPMRPGPGAIPYLRLGYLEPSILIPLGVHGDGQPLQPLRGLDFVAIAPIAHGVLHLVVDNELVYGRNDVEISLPWDVV